MASLFFLLDGQSHEIELFPDYAPKTLGKLLQHLPLEIDIHCAKIAGQHIFWHAPFVSDLEQAQDIHALPAGTFLYWPERQFLELIYGELQAEEAQVCVLGKLKGDISWLKTYGMQVLQNHGRQILSAQLIKGDGCEMFSVETPQPSSPELAWLRLERQKVWSAPPEELFILMRRRGMMLPYGPLAMVEGELRKLHELLWRLAHRADAMDVDSRAQSLLFLIEAFNARIDGFCGLAHCGQVLSKAAKFMVQAGLENELLEELILYTGRFAAWADAYIPWNSLNEVCLASLKEQGIE